MYNVLVRLRVIRKTKPPKTYTAKSGGCSNDFL
nr:MAG TPA_asm: hypothetical protein [Caudoviricetes sp.]